MLVRSSLKLKLRQAKLQETDFFPKVTVNYKIKRKKVLIILIPIIQVVKLLAFLFTILLVSAFKVDSLLGVIRFSCHERDSRVFLSVLFDIS